jgi:hypothetical protein
MNHRNRLEQQGDCMTFEEWWDFTYVRKGFMGDQPGVMGAAFKEVAEKAWDAALSMDAQQPLPPRQGAIVKWVAHHDYVPPPGDARNERSLVFIGEIPNMPGHGVFAGGSGKMHIGYHINEFVELTEDEV